MAWVATEHLLFGFRGKWWTLKFANDENERILAICQPCTGYKKRKITTGSKRAYNGYETVSKSGGVRRRTESVKMKEQSKLVLEKNATIAVYNPCHNVIMSRQHHRENMSRQYKEQLGYLALLRYNKCERENQIH